MKVKPPLWLNLSKYLFSFFGLTSWANQTVHNVHWISFFGHTSHHVRTLMITLPVEVAAMPYPHFLYLFSFFGGDRISILHTLSYRGSSIVILFFKYHVSLHWLQGGRVLCPVVLTLDSQESSFVDSHASCFSVF